MSEERFDGLLMSLAQQSQGIEPLLENLFSFLRRKSDFFSGADPNKIEGTVLDILRKHKSLAERDAAEKKKAAEKEARLKQERLEKKRKEEEASKAAAAAAIKTASTSTVAGEDDVLELSEDGSFDTAAAAAGTSSTTTRAATDIPTPPVKSSSTNEGSNEKDKDSDKEDEDDKTPPPPGNGGSTANYVWTQTLSEVTVTVKFPAGTKSKMLDVDMQNTKLKVAIKGQTPMIDGALHKRIVVDDSCWTIDNGEFVLTMTKDNRMEWWKCVIVGDPEINTQKVQPENSKLGELDAETRQTVEKMMFDQRQKAMGLPSSEEMQKQDMLKKFMAAHPEMDFSQAKFN